MKEVRGLNYRDYIEHYRVDGEVFDFEHEMDPAHRESVRRLGQSILWTARLTGRERVLDVGCGSGWLLSSLAESGIRELYGVDLSRGQYLKGGKGERRQGTFVEGDAYSLPFRSGSMDAVLMTELLEHLEEPLRGLKEAGRVLGKGGKLLLATPWKEKIRWTLCIHCNERTPLNAHLHSFDPATVEDSLKAAGLEVIRVDSLLNKALVNLRCHVMLRFLPAPLFRAVDRLSGLLVRKWTTIVALAMKPESP